MFHDRVSFGDPFIAMLALYVDGGIPVRGRQAWVWWVSQKQKPRL